MGIVGLTYSCAHSLQRYGVTSNAISPSAATRMGATVPVERRRARGRRTSGHRARRSAVVYFQRALGLVQRSDTLAVGYQIGLFNVPEVIQEIAYPEPWDLKLAAHMMEGFKPLHPEQRDTARRHRASRLTGGTGSGHAARTTEAAARSRWLCSNLV